MERGHSRKVILGRDNQPKIDIDDFALKINKKHVIKNTGKEKKTE